MTRNFGVIFTPYITNSREYNNRIPHQSLAGIGNGRAQAIFKGRANLGRPLTLLDWLEMGIPADVVKALVDDLEIKAIPRHEEQDGGIEVQQIVVAALASLQRIASDLNSLSVAIDDVNRRQMYHVLGSGII